MKNMASATTSAADRSAVSFRYRDLGARTPRLVPYPIRRPTNHRTTGTGPSRGTLMDSAGWDSRYRAADLVWGGEPNRFVAAEFVGEAPGRALDLAAGEGRNAIWLARAGWQVTAVDFSAVAVDRGQHLAEREGLTVDWVVADVREYQPAPRAFDAVVVAYLHLPADDLRPVLARAAQAVAAGGRILVVGHDLTNIADGIGGPPDPAVLYTPEAIAAALPDLRIRAAGRVHRPVSTEPGAAQAIDTLVCAVRA